MEDSSVLKKKLFLVVLGGRANGCHIEVHDVRWVVGATIEDTFSELKKQWWGIKKGLHIDSYREIKEVDGFDISISSNLAKEYPIDTHEKLWFVNIGAYEKDKMAEQHEYGLVVAKTSFSAKSKAKKKWLHGLEMQHKDDLHEVKQDGIDQLLLIEGNNEWKVQLSPKSKSDTSKNSAPDWYGYWPI